MIFEKSFRAGYGSHRLASMLNSMGIKTHNGSDFQCNTVNRILKNRTYCGYYISGEIVSPICPIFKLWTRQSMSRRKIFSASALPPTTTKLRLLATPNLDMLLSFAIGYIGTLSEKVDDSIEVIFIIQASKRLYGLSKFTFYAIADGLAENLRQALYRYLRLI